MVCEPSSGYSDSGSDDEESDPDDGGIAARVQWDPVEALAEFGETIVARIHPPVPAVILGRHDSWSYFVGGATISDLVTWESRHDIVYHSWGYQDVPTNFLGTLHFAGRLSRSEVISVLRSLYPTGRIQTDPLTSIKQISRSLRSVKELTHHHESRTRHVYLEEPNDTNF